MKVANIIFVCAALAGSALRLDAAAAVGVAAAPGSSKHGQPGSPSLISNQPLSANPSDHKWREANIKTQQAAEAEKAAQALREKLNATKDKVPLLWIKAQSKVQAPKLNLASRIEDWGLMHPKTYDNAKRLAAAFKDTADSVLSPTVALLVDAPMPSRKELDAAIADAKFGASYLRKLAKASLKAAAIIADPGKTPIRLPSPLPIDPNHGITKTLPELIRDELPPLSPPGPDGDGPLIRFERNDKRDQLVSHSLNFGWRRDAGPIIGKEMGGASTNPPVEHSEGGDEL